MKKIDFKTGILCIVIAFLLISLVGTAYLDIENARLNEELNVAQNILTKTVSDLSATRSDFAKITDELANTEVELQTEIEKSKGLSTSLGNMSKELETANTTIADLKSDEYELVYMGDFTITYYCDQRYSHICGGNGVTASGKPTEVGVTAAADWGVLPNGSTIYIEGIGFREIQDVGGAVNGKHVDVLVATHSEALSIGTGYEGVWLLVKKS